MEGLDWIGCDGIGRMGMGMWCGRQEREKGKNCLCLSYLQFGHALAPFLEQSTKKTSPSLFSRQSSGHSRTQPQSLPLTLEKGISAALSFFFTFINRINNHNNTEKPTENAICTGQESNNNILSGTAKWDLKPVHSANLNHGHSMDQHEKKYNRSSLVHQGQEKQHTAMACTSS